MNTKATDRVDYLLLVQTDKTRKKRRIRRMKQKKYDGYVRRMSLRCPYYPAILKDPDEAYFHMTVDEMENYEWSHKLSYKRYWQTGLNGKKSNRLKFYRRVGNRKVRRYKKGLGSRGSYRKVFDYRWTID